MRSRYFILVEIAVAIVAAVVLALLVNSNFTL